MAPSRPRPRKSRWRLGQLMPKRLYTRSLLIVILPMLLLQSVIALVFMERHWERTTRRLSAAVAQDIAAVIELHRLFPSKNDRAKLISVVNRKLDLRVSFLPDQPLPPSQPPPLFFILESVLSSEISKRIDRPFWVDARTDSSRVEVRVRLENEVMRAVTRVSRAYASNSHIFLVWMLGASLILITVSILFLRNQIRPIVQLAHAAENLGKGRPVAKFPVRGAQEVRLATQAFFAMRDRIERQIEQRTAMLAGVSHDLRTVLTRLRLQIALLPGSAERGDLESDVDEMERMLADYLAFARGDEGEASQPLDARTMLDEIAAKAGRGRAAPATSFSGSAMIIARPTALRRALDNLVVNACRFGTEVRLSGVHRDGQFVVTVDDNGPGIPPEQREDVFRPFVRLDQARNLDHPGSGLGLSIARDIARGHGGDVELSQSPLGGLRARLQIPA